MLSLVTARIRDTFVHKPLYVDGALDLVSVCRELAARHATHALVRDLREGTGRLGIFTTTDLRDALLLDTPPQRLAVRDVARFELVEVQADAEVFEALWLMVRHRVHRLLVRDGDQVLGVLGQLDLVSFVANHSHLVAQQIDHAESVADLREAVDRIDRMIVLLHGSGIRIERITRLVTELNRRLFARLWALLAPPALVEGSCLLVMGSEGRGEQILKTDQDNALLLRDGFDCPDLADVAARFNAALGEFGYPPCTGGIMLTTPLWRQPLAAFRETLRQWLYGHEVEGPMNLAIFFDAAAVAGDESLLAAARAHLDALLAGQDQYLARFAAAADQFHEPGNFWTRLTSGRKGRDETPLDLKKLGTFPIVHGVRALALQYQVREQGTAARLKALQAAGRIDEVLARDLLDALHFLMGLRLSHQLRQRAGGAQPGNEVRPSELGALEREPLHDALAIVKRFRGFLRQHFRLDSL
ncbi:MAG: CBS domain-containing protein [Rubrivivax sp.]|nr:CBS domain-containing protein [Rubrivivax sp.]